MKERVSERIANQKRRRRIASLLLVTILSLLLLFFGLAAYQQFTGNFTINLDYNERHKGLSLADNVNLLNPTSRLLADAVERMDNITWEDLKDKNLDTEKDGNHHGPATGAFQSNLYFCYTFYVFSQYEVSQSYEMKLNITQKAKGAEEAVRVVLWEDETYFTGSTSKRIETHYAWPKRDANGNLPAIWPAEDENPEPVVPFNPGWRPNFTNKNFYNPETVFYRNVTGFEPGKVRKYTLLIYLEGQDPECVDDILGGAVKMQLDITVLT